MRSLYSPPFSTSAVRMVVRPESIWNVELLLRYAAATATTWIALAGAQLIVPSNFALALAVLALLGVPVSLYLRLTDMRVGIITLPRPLWNGLTVIGSGIVGAFYLYPKINEMVMVWNTEPQGFWLRFGAGDSLELLMQAFLVFAALRSFAIISDKDATLTTIPSFSVLLLLIPVHKGIEVVCYFIAWTIVATVLFALDHRAEQSAGVIARVPSPVPGQDVRLAARSLLTILGVSLAAAVAVSAYLTSRNPEERSEAETAITSLAARLTQFALSLPDGSVNSGPERQIDFSSGPNLPSRTELWRAFALTMDRRSIRPDYWRMFSLSVYNGNSWAQAPSRQVSVKKSEIDWIPSSYWGFGGGFPLGGGIPNLNRGDRRRDFQGRGTFGGFGRWDFGQGDFNRQQSGRREFSGDSRPRRENRLANERRNDRALDGQRDAGNTEEARRLFRGTLPENPSSSSYFGAFNPKYFKPVPGYPGAFTRKEEGFAVGKVSPAAHQYGLSVALVRMRVQAQNANLGYIPMLPGADTLNMRSRDRNEVRVGFDGATDLGVMQPGEQARFMGQVPRLRDYGFRNGEPPTKLIPVTKNAPVLDSRERKLNLQLPLSVTKRTREYAVSALKSADKSVSNYTRAHLLAEAIQDNAVYTLRPPAVPEGRDATDFFLFDGSKRGYCTYFAGALTVLCRSQGIPARVVSGFASPEYIGNEAIIRDANAHAWTEVWVDNWGWALVDATPADDRGDNSPTWIESWGDWFGATMDSVSRGVRAQWPILAVAVVGLLLLVMRWKRLAPLRRHRRADQLPELQRREIAQQYERMSHLLAKRFRPRATWETPDEWLAAAQRALPRLPLEPLQHLTQLYVQAQFSPRPLGQTAPEQAREAVQRVRQFQWRQKTA